MTKITEFPREMPRSVLDIECPNSCGLIAAAAWTYLTRHCVPVRILYIRYSKHYGHAITVFESSGHLYTFDQDGTMRFDSTGMWKTPPVVLARAWAEAVGEKRPVRSAKWFKEKETT